MLFVVLFCPVYLQCIVLIGCCVFLHFSFWNFALIFTQACYFPEAVIVTCLHLLCHICHVTLWCYGLCVCLQEEPIQKVSQTAVMCGNAVLCLFCSTLLVSLRISPKDNVCLSDDAVYALLAITFGYMFFGAGLAFVFTFGVFLNNRSCNSMLALNAEWVYAGPALI